MATTESASKTSDAALAPPCSVIVVNYNAGDLLLQCIAAALVNTPVAEVILVDNASADGSVEKVQAKYPQIKIIQNAENQGFAVAANQGLEAACGEWLLLLNPDCLLQADTLEGMLSVLGDYPQVGMAGCRIMNPDGSEQRGCRRQLPTLGSGLRKASGRQGAGSMDLYQQALPEHPLMVEAISGAFMLVRRQGLDAVGLLDEGYFMHCEDLDWCRRFIDAGWKILFVPQIEIVHHQGSCSTSTPVRVSWHLHRGMIRYYRKFLQQEHPAITSMMVIPGIYARFLALNVGTIFKRLLGRMRRG